MMNEYQMKLEEGNKVTLPESLVNKLLLRKGETVCLIQEDGIKDKCIVEQGLMVITYRQYVLSYLGKDMITCLLKQNVDLGLFAKDLVDLLNEQTIEEAV